MALALLLVALALWLPCVALQPVQGGLVAPQAWCGLLGVHLCGFLLHNDPSTLAGSCWGRGWSQHSPIPAVCVVGTLPLKEHLLGSLIRVGDQLLSKWSLYEIPHCFAEWQHLGHLLVVLLRQIALSPWGAFSGILLVH